MQINSDVEKKVFYSLNLILEALFKEPFSKILLSSVSNLLKKDERMLDSYRDGTRPNKKEYPLVPLV